MIKIGDRVKVKSIMFDNRWFWGVVVKTPLERNDNNYTVKCQEWDNGDSLHSTLGVHRDRVTGSSCPMEVT